MIIPGGVTLATVIFSFGLLGYLGFTFGNLAGLLPAILAGICLADSIHLLKVYFSETSKGLTKEKAMECCDQYSMLRQMTC